MSIADFTAMPVSRALEAAQGIQLAGREAAIAGRVMHEVVERLQFLNAVGLGYICAAIVRRPRSPAARRSAFGWPRKSARNCAACCMCWTSPPSDCITATTGACSMRWRILRDLGNTVLVVEHDEETIRASRLRRRSRSRSGPARRQPGCPRHSGRNHAAAGLADRSLHLRPNLD